MIAPTVAEYEAFLAELYPPKSSPGVSCYDTATSGVPVGRPFATTSSSESENGALAADLFWGSLSYLASLLLPQACQARARDSIISGHVMLQHLLKRDRRPERPCCQRCVPKAIQLLVLLQVFKPLVRLRRLRDSVSSGQSSSDSFWDLYSLEEKKTEIGKVLSRAVPLTMNSVFFSQTGRHSRRSALPIGGRLSRLRYNEHHRRHCGDREGCAFPHHRGDDPLQGP